MIARNDIYIYGALGLLGIFGPILFPNYTLSIAYLWMMVLMASTWDTLGGQTGYNSLGNITFFLEPRLKIIKIASELITINKLALVNEISKTPTLISGPIL